MKITIDLETLPEEVQQTLYVVLKEKFEHAAGEGGRSPTLLRKQLLRKPLREFSKELSPKVVRILNMRQIHSVKLLTHCTGSFLLSIRNFGEGSLKKVEDFLKTKGLELQKEV